MEPLRKREGFRHLWLGDSGMGKTTANVILLNHIRRQRLANLIVTVDDKARWVQQYKGLTRIAPHHLRSEPPKAGEDAGHIVFRGIAYAGRRQDIIDHTAVSDMCWDLVAQSPCSVVLNIDELADATNGHQTWDGESLAQIYRKGRGAGLSVVASTQLPQLLPREAFALPETVCVFRLSGREAKYLYDYRVIAKSDIPVIEGLKVGEFRFFRKSQPADANIYRF